MNDRKHFQSRITTTQRAEVGHAKRLGIGLARVALIFLLVAEGGGSRTAPIRDFPPNAHSDPGLPAPKRVPGWPNQ